YIFASRYSDALLGRGGAWSRPGWAAAAGCPGSKACACRCPAAGRLEWRSCFQAVAQARRTQEQRVDFSFTEEQLMIQDVARRIAQEKIAPSAEHHDRTGDFPLENMRMLGENGLMGIEVPEAYGGAGMDPVAYVLAMVEVAAA